MKSLEQIEQIKDYKERSDALEERSQELQKRCSNRYLADIGWSKLKTKEDWRSAKKEALGKYKSGQFFVERIGRYKEVDPEFMAVLLCVREQWVEDYQIETAPEFLLLDCALVSYYHLIRTNAAVGNFEAIIEDEFFFRESPRIKWKKNYGAQADGFWVENKLVRLTEQLLPQLELFNKLLIRNIKTIRDLKRSNQNLNIGQVNIGDKQINVGKDPN